MVLRSLGFFKSKHASTLVKIECGLGVASCGLLVASCGLRVTGYGLEGQTLSA